MEKTKNRLRSTDAYVSMALGLVVVLGIGLLIYNFVSARRTTNTATVQEPEKQQTASTVLPATYTVATGDTLWSISEKHIKSGYNWVDIQKANKLANADTIEVGQKLVIPTVAPIQVGQITSGVSNVAPPKTYTVASGDTLWSIALKNYQSGYKWVDIAQANKLADPNLIFSGSVLTLP